MTREIKFRAWDKGGREMIKSIQMLSFMSDGDIIVSGKGGSVSGRDFELMQFTGLKDKNGKEIYEGDIIIDHEDLKREIIFEDGMFCFRRLNGSREIPNKWFSKHSEIIGNIYENPNLLEQL